jgi:hypothetical protein
MISCEQCNKVLIKMLSTVVLWLFMYCLLYFLNVLCIVASSGNKELLVDEQPLEENVNRLQFEGDARTVEEAIKVLRYKCV